MNLHDLDAVHRARPFRPFTLCLADGDKVQVEHPEFLARSPSGRTVVVTATDESVRLIDGRLVTNIHVESPTEPSE